MEIHVVFSEVENIAAFPQLAYKKTRENGNTDKEFNHFLHEYSG